jgi:cytochrome c553
LAGLLLGGHAAAAEALSDKIALCATCHGAAGLPEDPLVPIIWGQHFYYVYVQLKDYKAGRRQHEVMSEIVAGLSKQDLQALAQHFSEQAWPAIGFRAGDQDISNGERAAAAGQCVQCHLGGYEGNSRVPRLAGQKASYLERTMLDFKHKARKNAPAKSSLLASYEDSAIAALARYLAGM